MVALGGAGTALALLLFGLAQQASLAVLACLLAGVSWIVVLATLNVSAQVALPEWVRGRGLAAYAAVFFGTMSVGSLLWGYMATRIGLANAHFIAAGGALLVVFATRRWRLHTGPQADLAPSMHWPAPLLAGAVAQDAGPVMVTVEYSVAAAERAAFFSDLKHVARERRRDGAYDWGVFEDTAHPGQVVEIFYLDSWLEHLRQHRRVTRSDRLVEDALRKHVRAPPRITHYVAPRETLDGG
jgi:MFS family permease